MSSCGGRSVKLEKFEDLKAWQEARRLTVMVFELCKKEELRSEYSLTGQIKRSSVSIMANIAEGFGRFGLKDSKQFYITARASLSETQSHLYVLKDISSISDKEFFQYL